LSTTLLGGVLQCCDPRDGWDTVSPSIVKNGFPKVVPSDPKNAYHWDGKKDPFFEGWYFNVKDPDQKAAFLFIYGVINPAETGDNHSEAFVYVADAITGEQIYQTFDVAELWASEDTCDFQVAGNRATENRIVGQVVEAGKKASWELDIQIDSDMPDPGGWLDKIPNLPLRWYVNAVRARATGTVTWNGATHKFKGAQAFNDHQWGAAFPDSYMWLQADFSPSADLTVVAGGGDLVQGELKLDGYFIGVLHKGKKIVFRTTDFHWIHTTASRTAYRMRAFNARHKVEIDIKGEKHTMMHLRCPTLDNGMMPRAWESLQGAIKVRLYERKGLFPFKLADEFTTLAGMEYAGPQ
jgi:tocopherol cyclase